MDWLRQAERDLAQAQDSDRWGRHEWSCFTAHQAAEKALKALHLHHGQESWGHVLARLLKELPKDVRFAEEFIDKAHTLDGIREEILCVGYFGSYARNEWGVGSDCDIAVVARHTDEPFEKRSRVYDADSLPVPADVLVYTAGAESC